MLRLQWRRIRSRYPWLQILQTWRCLVVACFCIILILYIVITFQKPPQPYFENNIKEITIGNIEFDFQIGLFFFKDKKDVYLRGSMSDSLRQQGPPTHCGEYNTSKHMCAIWYTMVRLEVINIHEEHATCQTITWTPTFNGYEPETCFSLAEANWFGGSLLYDQVWPLNHGSLPSQPYLTHDLQEYQGEVNTVGNVLDRFWMSSTGAAVMVDRSSLPVLHVSINESNNNLLCLQAKSSTQQPILKYTVCKSANLRKIHRFVTSKIIQLPKKLPAESFFAKPIWSSYPVFQKGITQSNLLEFAKNVVDHDINRYFMEVYDDSTVLFRDNPLTKGEFPNAHQTIYYFREYDFEIHLGISPFVSLNNSIERTKLIVGTSGQPIETEWRGKPVHVIDLSNEEVYSWYVEHLKDLITNLGFKSFRLVGSESNFLTAKSHSMYSGSFSKHFLNVGEALGVTVISSHGYLSQQYGSITTLTSRESSWTYKSGLRSVIPSVLTLGLLGYPFVIPNIIGGYGYRRTVNTTYTTVDKPDRELYIRWMGIAAYMPCMMFSYPPWLYDDEVVEMAKTFTKVHEDLVSPLVIKASREFEISGTPIIRPLWWHDPIDKTAQRVDNEFLVGDSLLVAPITEENSIHRDIYLPVGKWRDEINNRVVVGPVWLKRSEIQLSQVATFTKVLL